MPYNDNLPADGVTPWGTAMRNAWNNLKAFVNLLETNLGTKATIADASTVTSSTWSSQKINDAITAAKTQLLNGPPAALDTLNELAAALNDDPAFAATVTTALAARVRTDTAAQGLTTTQKSNARTNIAAVGSSDGGWTDFRKAATVSALPDPSTVPSTVLYVVLAP